MLKISPFFKKNTNFTGEQLEGIIITSGYYFYTNLNIWEDFQIYISASLRLLLYLTAVNLKANGGISYRADLLKNTDLPFRHIMLLIYTYIMIVKVDSIVLLLR